MRDALRPGGQLAVHNLTRYERGLSPELYTEFVDRSRRRLLERLGARTPYFHTFKRVLFWGQLSER